MKPKELADKLGTTAMQVGRLRAKHCTEEDVDGKDILPSGVGKIIVAHQKIEDKKAQAKLAEAIGIEPEVKEVNFRVLSNCVNRIFVEGYVEGRRPKKKVRCAIPARLSKSISAGSKFKAHEGKRPDGETFYRHAKCKR